MVFSCNGDCVKEGMNEEKEANGRLTYFGGVEFDSSLYETSNGFLVWKNMTLTNDGNPCSQLQLCECYANFCGAVTLLYFTPLTWT